MVRSAVRGSGVCVRGAALPLVGMVTTISFQELTLRVEACESAQTGADLWPASTGLCHWLFAHQQLLHGRRVLELGCGLALPSLLLTACGAGVADALATDESQTLVDHVTHNAELNNVRLSARRLDFTSRDEVYSSP